MRESPPGTPVKMPWSRCARALAQVMLLLLIVSPWIIRVAVFFSFEDETVMLKAQAAEDNNLDMHFRVCFLKGWI